MQTLSRTRLSVSPVMEALQWLNLTATGGRHPIFGAPGPAARYVLGHPDVALLIVLLPVSGGFRVPDLLTPKPRSGPWKTILNTQLAEIESTGQNDIDAQVLGTVEAPAGHPLSTRVRRLAETGDLQRRLTAGIERFWRETLHHDWPSLQTVLDRDIAERSRLLAQHGIGHVLNGLHPDVHWTRDGLVIDSHHDHVVDLADHDLVLAATALSRTTLLLQVENPAQATMYYPAGRIGTADPRAPAALAEVIGTVRAARLTDLAVARSTADLAIRHAMAASTISYHLSALTRARLLSRQRDGRHVLYQRTEQAASLLDAQGTAPGR